MTEVKAASYLSVMKLNKMAVFEWDLIEDTLNFDEMMKLVTQHEIPKTNAKENLLKARLIHPKDRLEFRNHVNRMLTMKTLRSAPFQDYSLDCRIYTTNRYYIWVRLIYRAQFNEGTVFRVVGSIQNVDSALQEQARLKNELEHDAMTGLYSKTHAQYLVNQVLNDNTKMNALLAIDLDNFKNVNDKLGHLIGDAVIMDMAMNLKTTFRKYDILGHIGGDEFMVLMKDIKSSAMVIQKCEKLRNLLRRTYKHENEEVSVSSSIGIAISPMHGSDYKTLFANADSALFESKRNGKDTQTIYSKEFKSSTHKDREDVELPIQNFRKMLTNPMEYIFQMVFNAKDTSLSVQLLLQIFAKYFKVHRAYVFWHVDGPYWPRILFDYVHGDFKSTEVAHDPPLRLQIRRRYRNTKNGRFSECSDTSKLTDRARKEFERRQICAYIECAVMDGDHFMGVVGFDDCKKTRIWTKEEHDILFAFAEIMRRFLFGQIYFEMTKRNGRWGL